MLTFIAGHIDSVHTLEVLLLLLRERARVWAVEEVHERVKSSVGAVRESLLGLVKAGLAKKCGAENSAFQYSPRSSVVDTQAIELAAMYAERSTAVVELIYSRPLRVIRGSTGSSDTRKRSE